MIQVKQISPGGTGDSSFFELPRHKFVPQFADEVRLGCLVRFPRVVQAPNGLEVLHPPKKTALLNRSAGERRGGQIKGAEMAGGCIADNETDVVGLGRKVHADEELDGIARGILELGFFKNEFRFADSVAKDTAR
jgi:hypothetical protein